MKDDPPPPKPPPPPPQELQPLGDSPFDRPVRRPVPGQPQRRFWMRRKFRIAYWIICLTLIGLLLLYLKGLVGQVESLTK